MSGACSHCLLTISKEIRWAYLWAQRVTTGTRQSETKFQMLLQFFSGSNKMLSSSKGDGKTTHFQEGAIQSCSKKNTMQKCSQAPHPMHCVGSCLTAAQCPPLHTEELQKEEFWQQAPWKAQCGLIVVHIMLQRQKHQNNWSTAASWSVCCHRSPTTSPNPSVLPDSLPRVLPNPNSRKIMGSLLLT